MFSSPILNAARPRPRLSLIESIFRSWSWFRRPFSSNQTVQRRHRPGSARWSERRQLRSGAHPRAPLPARRVLLFIIRASMLLSGELWVGLASTCCGGARATGTCNEETPGREALETVVTFLYL